MPAANPGGGDDWAVFDEERLRSNANPRKRRRKLGGITPVSRHAAIVQQARLGEDEYASADRCHPRATSRRIAQRFQNSGLDVVARSRPGDHHRVRRFQSVESARDDHIKPSAGLHPARTCGTGRGRVRGLTVDLDTPEEQIGYREFEGADRRNRNDSYLVHGQILRICGNPATTLVGGSPR
jgi:hypothetical protein